MHQLPDQKIAAFYSRLSNFPIWFYLFLLIANLGIKFYNISYDSYNLDEAWHMFYAQKPFAELIQTALEDPNPPLYNILEGFWIKNFGISELGIRSLSVILSALTALLLFYFCKKNINIQTAFWAALLFTVSDIHYLYSHNARCYALLCFLAVLSFIFFYELMRSVSVKNSIAFVFINILMLYTHTICVFVFAVQFIAALFFYKSQLKKVFLFVLTLALTALSFIPWVLSSPYYKKEQATSWMPPPSLQEIAEFFVYYFGSITLFVFFIVCGIALIIFYFTNQPTKQVVKNFRNNFVLLLLWSLLPIALNIAVSYFVVPVFLPRYTLYASIGLYVLFVFIILNLPLREWSKAVILLIIVVFSAITIKFNETKGEPWREVAQAVKEKQTENTLVLICPYFQYPTFTFYYNRDFYIDYEHTVLKLARDNVYMADNPNIFSDMDADDFSKVVLVTSHIKVVDPTPIISYLKNHFVLENEEVFSGITVYTFNNKNKTASRRKFTIDFEKFEKENRPSNIIEVPFAHSGKYVTIADTVDIYSRGFTKKISNIQLPVKVLTINAWYYSNSENIKAGLICSFENVDSLYMIKKMKLPASAVPNQWNKITFNVMFPPEHSPADVIKIYMLNEGKEKIYADDFDIQFYE